jgi:hypothetical protein
MALVIDIIQNNNLAFKTNQIRGRQYLPGNDGFTGKFLPGGQRFRAITDSNDSGKMGPLRGGKRPRSSYWKKERIACGR